jgi:molybdenum cofactor synthesis domain-containing protein
VSARAAILTVSTSKSRDGAGSDESGDRLAALLEELDAEIVGREIIPDDAERIAARIMHWADVERCDLILTTGGTGFAPTDVTPEATSTVIEKPAPGISEAMRAASRDHTRHWMLSRAIAGVRGRSLVINFPGSPDSISQTGAALAAALPHALDLLAGRHSPHHDPSSGGRA